MEIRQYRRCLIGLLLVSLAGLGILGYRKIRDGIPDSYTQTEGEPGPEYSGFFVTQEIKPGLTEASANAYGSAYPSEFIWRQRAF